MCHNVPCADEVKPEENSSINGVRATTLQGLLLPVKFRSSFEGVPDAVVCLQGTRQRSLTNHMLTHAEHRRMPLPDLYDVAVVSRELKLIKQKRNLSVSGRRKSDMPLA